ncbi:hypothetical protein SAMN05444274_10460 [Mariniphaga anaerophila]|uniref:DUF6250 domain-containing protein n=2 Tax=Mariniphaga anaerophila TaxID=1484053 RepID=A0A1M4ZTJ1_9BACT|nr:hypothetical protein SAMN05444274_10460 [Mariniphaga anaerophila]
MMMMSVVSGKKERIIIKESFDYPDGKLPSIWWSEGCEAELKDGRLFVDADTTSYRASTIWLDHELSGSLKIEFDAHIVASSDNANNINCFLLYSDPEGRPLRETAQERECGSYGLYHELNGYIFTNVANGEESNVRFRVRDNPGFYLLNENYRGETKAGKTYHIKIEKTNSRFQYWINGEKIIDMEDKSYNPLYNKGLFGFRTWHTAIWWDNLVITQLD